MISWFLNRWETLLKEVWNFFRKTYIFLNEDLVKLLYIWKNCRLMRKTLKDLFGIFFLGTELRQYCSLPVDGIWNWFYWRIKSSPERKPPMRNSKQSLRKLFCKTTLLFPSLIVRKACFTCQRIFQKVTTLDVLGRVHVNVTVYYYVSVKGKAISLQAWTGPEGSRRLRFPDFKTIGTWRW